MSGSRVSSVVSTLISLLVVGIAGAVVLWITLGDMAQPATKEKESAGGGDPDRGDEAAHGAATGAAGPFDQDAPDPVIAPVEQPVPVAAAVDATGPAEGAVPQAAPSRPAEPAAVDRPPVRSRRTVSLPGSYSFDPAPPLTWRRRLRSALAVVLVVTAVGLALAASVGVLVVFVSRALEGAVN